MSFNGDQQYIPTISQDIISPKVTSHQLVRRRQLSRHQNQQNKHQTQKIKPINFQPHQDILVYSNDEISRPSIFKRKVFPHLSPNSKKTNKLNESQNLINSLTYDQTYSDIFKSNGRNTQSYFSNQHILSSKLQELKSTNVCVDPVKELKNYIKSEGISRQNKLGGRHVSTFNINEQSSLVEEIVDNVGQLERKRSRSASRNKSISAAVEIKKFMHYKSMGEVAQELIKAQQAINTNSFDKKIDFENNLEGPEKKQGFVQFEAKIQKKLKDNMIYQIGSYQNYDSSKVDLKNLPEQQENLKKKNRILSTIENSLGYLKVKTGFLPADVEERVREILGSDQAIINQIGPGDNDWHLEDLLTEDELNKIRFNPLKPVYDQISANLREKGGGYEKTLDYKLKQEFIQRRQMQKWMLSRGKICGINDFFDIDRPLEAQQQKKVILQEGSLNFVEIPRSTLQTAYVDQKGRNYLQASRFPTVQNGDLQNYFNSDLLKTNEIISMDRLNIEIIQFVASLFLSWVEDYRLEAQLQKDRNLTHHLFAMNEGVEANIKLKCLPIDYFLQRVLQIGLCTTMPGLRNMVDTMLQLCNAGKAPMAWNQYETGSDFQQTTQDEFEKSKRLKQNQTVEEYLISQDESNNLKISNSNIESNDQQSAQFIFSNFQTQREKLIIYDARHLVQEITSRPRTANFTEDSVTPTATQKQLVRRGDSTQSGDNKSQDQFHNKSQSSSKLRSLEERLKDDDNFVPMNFHGKDAVAYMKKGMDKWLFQNTNRVNLPQFLSLFNVIGVGNAKKIDLFVGILKNRAAQVKKKQFLKEQADRDEFDRRLNRVRIFAKVNDGAGDAGQHQDKKLTPRKLKKIQKQKIDRIKENISGHRSLTPSQRQLAGLGARSISQHQIFIKQLASQPELHPAHQQKKLSQELKNIEISQSRFDNENDEIFYDLVIKDLQKIQNVNFLLRHNPIQLCENKEKDFQKHLQRVKKVIEKLIKGRNYKNQESAQILLKQIQNVVRNNGLAIEPVVVLEILKQKGGPQKFLAEYFKLVQQDKNDAESSFNRSDSSDLTILKEESQEDKQYSKQSQIQKSVNLNQKMNISEEQRMKRNSSKKQNSVEIQKTSSQPQLFSQLQKNLINSTAFLNINSKDEVNSTVSSNNNPNIAHNISQKIKENLKQKIITNKQTPNNIFKQNLFQRSSIKIGSVSIDSQSIEALRKKKKQEDALNDAVQNQNKYHNDHKASVKAKQTLCKQMVLKEICQDLIKTKVILMDMVKLDSVNNILTKITNNQIFGFRSKSADIRTLTDKEVLFRRQKVRKQFQDFIVRGLVNKYARQCGLFYSGQEAKIGFDILNGAATRMRMPPEDYGKIARKRIVKIATLMIKYGIDLNQENFQDPCKFVSSAKTAAASKIPSGIFGWQMLLAKHEDIREEVNKLVNLIAEEIEDRKETFNYPNEEVEDLIEQGRQMWFEEIDPNKSLVVPRYMLDDLLIRLGIVQHFQSVNRFLAGALSGVVIKRHETIKYSQFMKLVRKAALRECVKNIIAFNQFGFDVRKNKLVETDIEIQAVNLPQQIMRYQRAVLYAGIKTKNTVRKNEENKEDYFTNSKACSNIVTNLQNLMATPLIVNSDQCKIKLEHLIGQLRNEQEQLLDKQDMHLNFEIAPEWYDLIYGKAIFPDLDNLRYDIKVFITIVQGGADSTKVFEIEGDSLQKINFKKIDLWGLLVIIRKQKQTKN